MDKNQYEQDFLQQQLANTKYPCTQSALSFIQLQAQEEILEWIIQEN